MKNKLLFSVTISQLTKDALVVGIHSSFKKNAHVFNIKHFFHLFYLINFVDGPSDIIGSLNNSLLILGISNLRNHVLFIVHGKGKQIGTFLFAHLNDNLNLLSVTNVCYFVTSAFQEGENCLLHCDSFLFFNVQVFFDLFHECFQERVDILILLFPLFLDLLKLLKEILDGLALIFLTFLEL